VIHTKTLINRCVEESRHQALHNAAAYKDVALKPVPEKDRPNHDRLCANLADDLEKNAAIPYSGPDSVVKIEIDDLSRPVNTPQYPILMQYGPSSGRRTNNAWPRRMFRELRRAARTTLRSQWRRNADPTGGSQDIACATT
jgi:hypothetical protein